jgi:hypothetical protein
MFKRRKKTTMPSIQQQNPIPAPVSEEPSIADVKSSLDKFYKTAELITDRLHRHLNDRELTAEPELHSFIYRMANVCRDARDGMRVTRELAGIRS